MLKVNRTIELYLFGKDFSMAGLAYSRPNPDKIAPGIETLLRKELGSSTPLPYQILPGEGEGATPKSVFADISKAMILTKHQSDVPFEFYFQPDLPPAVE